ncbi:MULTISPECIES: universal stress protein [unclassified Microbacterium]|uniref:universal stress protein n=1 Tax=unclassified Microbacterium TaxID=2609290 RepID=UPI0012F7DDC6|nr:universal stress protein [Microbacterium sp. MAH-37]MVQ40845.1 universal stress protein [Microbacterium sp. MAH-37]
MTSSIVVGYTATAAGADALALGIRLARATDARLHVVIVLPLEGTRSKAVAPERAYEDLLAGQARSWLEDAVTAIPAGVVHSAHVRFAESFGEGLLSAADEFGAVLLVLGAANGGALRRHRLGSVASELLHTSTVPVALAPAGLSGEADAGLPRITVATGTRPGAERLLQSAVRLAAASGAAVRLVSLMPLDVPAGLNTGAITLVQDAHVDQVLAAARDRLPAETEVEVLQAGGDSIEDAVAQLDWLPGEVVLVGSSRLAQPRRLFLGSTAAKMLRELPVPMIVVPRTGTEAGDR